MKSRILPLLAFALVLAACDGTQVPTAVTPEPEVPELSSSVAAKLRTLPPGVTLTAEQIAWLEEIDRKRAANQGLVPTPPDFGGEIDMAWEGSYGTNLGLWDDSCSGQSIGFSFVFYGATYTNLHVNSNGNLTFNGCNTAYWSTNIPDGGWAIAAPIYGDWNPSWYGGVYANVLGSAPNRRFIATWYVVPEYGFGGSNTFQAILFEGSNNIQFGYNGITTNGSHWCCGVQNVGISSGTGSWINSASGGAIPALNGKNICYKPSGSGYTSFIGECKPADTTPPVITPNISGTLGTGGWYTSNVTVTWTVTDPDGPISSSTGCGASTVSTDTNGVTFTCTATSDGGTASNSVTVKRDASPPIVTGSASGTLGTNGWYTSTVNVSFATSDPTSGIASSAGCAASTHSTDTNSMTLTCSATNGAGLSAGTAVTFKRDATLPTISFSGATSYTVDQTVAITCSAGDAMSGVGSTTCPAVVSGPAYTFALGANTASESATDNAGNSRTASVSFTISVTHGSLCNLVKQFVSQNGIANSLCVKLENSADARSRGNANASQNQLNAFRNEVAAQSGKALTAAQATVLTVLSMAL